MPVLREEPPNTPLPSPFPEGWYFVTSRKDLDGDKLIRKTWMGTEIVVWSDGQGGVCVSEAYCPHLGADLGPAAGGRVRDGRLVCGFHGFEYDTGGQCVATPFAPPVKAARLRVFEPREIAGLIFAWWGIDGRQPQWQLPTEEPDQAGWSGLHIWTSRFAGHPQETTENSVDLAHLRYVHGYDSVSRVEALAVDGPLLLSDFDFATTRKITRFASTKLKVSAKTLVAGLGYSFVEIREHTIGLDMRLWILATPVDGTVIDLSVSLPDGRDSQSEPLDRGSGIPSGETARPHHEQDHGVLRAARRVAGRADLEHQELPAPAAPGPLGRRDHAVPLLLRPVLSRCVG